MERTHPNFRWIAGNAKPILMLRSFVVPPFPFSPSFSLLLPYPPSPLNTANCIVQPILLTVSLVPAATHRANQLFLRALASQAL